MILIAEAEPIQDLMRRRVQEEGYQVRATSNLTEAKRLLTQNRQIRLVVIAKSLQQDQDGLDWFRQLKSLAGVIPLLTVNDGEGLNERDRPLLTKPYTPIDLLYRIQELYGLPIKSD